MSNETLLIKKLLNSYYENNKEKEINLLNFFKNCLEKINDDSDDSNVYKIKQIKAIYEDNSDRQTHYDNNLGFYICYPYKIYSYKENGDDYESMMKINGYIDKLKDDSDEFDNLNKVKHTIYDIFGSLIPTGIKINELSSFKGSGKKLLKRKSVKKKSLKRKSVKKKNSKTKKKL